MLCDEKSLPIRCQQDSAPQTILIPKSRISTAPFLFSCRVTLSSNTFTLKFAHYHAMGFFNTCWELVLHLPFFSPLDGGGFERDGSQLPLSSDPSGGVIIHPEHASPGFTCSYPSLEGWKSCNSPDDRSCWLKDSRANQPNFSQYDIHTDCMPPYLAFTFALSLSKSLTESTLQMRLSGHRELLGRYVIYHKLHVSPY